MKSEIPPDDRDAAWTRLAEAGAEARKHLPVREEAAPFGFAIRVVACWQEMRREERLRLLQRWSLRAAFGSICLLVLAVVWAVAADHSGSSQVSLDVPELHLSLP